MEDTLQYLAGILDSRGCFVKKYVKRFNKRYVQYQFKLTDKRKKFIHNLANCLTSIGIERFCITKYNGVYTLWITDRWTLLKFYTLILPYLKVRNKEIKKFIRELKKLERKLTL